MAETVKPVKAWALVGPHGLASARMFHEKWRADVALGVHVFKHRVIPVLITPIEDPAQDA